MPSTAFKKRTDAEPLKDTVEKLFKAAFESTSAVYRHASCCGWRLCLTARMPLPLPDELRLGLQPSPKGDGPPHIQTYETEESFIIEVTLTGIRKESLFLEVAGNLLIINGERVVSPDTLSEDRDFVDPRFQRFIRLPRTARPNRIQARLKGNIIKIDVRKDKQNR